MAASIVWMRFTQAILRCHGCGRAVGLANRPGRPTRPIVFRALRPSAAACGPWMPYFVWYVESAWEGRKATGHVRCNSPDDLIPVAHQHRNSVPRVTPSSRAAEVFDPVVLLAGRGDLSFGPRLRRSSSAEWPPESSLEPWRATIRRSPQRPPPWEFAEGAEHEELAHNCFPNGLVPLQEPTKKAPPSAVRGGLKGEKAWLGANRVELSCDQPMEGVIKAQGWLLAEARSKREVGERLRLVQSTSMPRPGNGQQRQAPGVESRALASKDRLN